MTRISYHSSRPEKLAAYNSALITVFAVVLGGVVHLLSPELSDVWLIVITGISTFLFSFFLLRFTLDKFIYERLKIIYKTIRTLKLSKDADKHSLKTSTIEEVNREVIEWSEKQQKEIDDLVAKANYRREFLGNISHELKTPIFNIQGYVLTLLDGGLEDPTINREYLVRTEQSVNRMIAIIKDLEEIAKLESGELELKVEKIDIVALTKEVFEFLEINARKKNIQLYFKENYSRPIYVMGDRERIRQMLGNLIDNSIKYGCDEDGKTKVSFFDFDEESILVEVTDNGAGMEASEVTRIFERFYRIEKGRSREEGGSGLGLAIVKHVIEAHKQTINVRSTPGVGTTFAFTLRRA